jgi:hypothetical protein
MDIGRSLPIPGALITSLLLSVFLFWVTGQPNYTVIGQTAVSPMIVENQELASGGSYPIISSLIEAADFILSIGVQNPSDFKSDDQLVGQNQTEENQIHIINPLGSSCDVSSNYPDKILQWCELITQNALKQDIDPDLLAALIWQESGGNPQAYSHSGAVGLMQVMPRDGLAASFQCPNGPCFKNRPTINQLQDPDFNVSYGTKMLSGLISRRGSMREGLKSYGPADVGYSYADKVIGIYKRYGE